MHVCTCHSVWKSEDTSGVDPCLHPSCVTGVSFIVITVFLPTVCVRLTGPPPSRDSPDCLRSTSGVLRLEADPGRLGFFFFFFFWVLEIQIQILMLA